MNVELPHVHISETHLEESLDLAVEEVYDLSLQEFAAEGLLRVGITTI